MKKVIPFISFFILMVFGFGLFGNESSAAKRIDLLSWEEVNEILPRYSKFTVCDLETGKQFNVQRRAGKRHADVQPLTPKDTEIMKEIYQGKWSWRRRAIIVANGEKQIAASMHGMPHGAGALPNNFPGHFCIHFYGSTTHRTNKMDRSHKLMILKAAGKLEGYLQTQNAYETALSFMSGIKEHDATITKLLSANEVKWDEVFKIVENVKLTESGPWEDTDEAYRLEMNIPLKIDFYLEGEGKKKFSGKLKLIRTGQLDAWKVDAATFLSENGFLR